MTGAACHTHDGIVDHDEGYHHAGDRGDATGGWHDAGDYGNAWRPIHAQCGWFFIPLGQATSIHLGTVLTTWWCIRHEVLFRWAAR